MIPDIRVETNTLFIPVDLYEPLNEEQLNQVAAEINAVQNSPLGHIRCWVEESRLSLAIPAEDGEVCPEAYCNLADLVMALCDANDNRADFIQTLILISNYLNARPRPVGEREGDRISAEVETFASLVIQSGFPTYELEATCFDMFEVLASRKPDASEKADTKAFIVQKKLTTK